MAPSTPQALGAFHRHALSRRRLQRRRRSIPAPSSSPARRSSGRTRAPSTKSSPRKRANSSAPPPATSSNAAWRRTARARSRCRATRGSSVLHVDIGGGTTKLALIDKGDDRQRRRLRGRRPSASRTDDSGDWTRIDDSAQLAAEDLGIATDAGSARRCRHRAQQIVAAARRRSRPIHVLGAPLDALGRS